MNADVLFRAAEFVLTVLINGLWQGALVAGARITLARRLVDQLPDTLKNLSGGVISPVHARVLADRVDGLDPAAMVAVERRVLPRAGRQTVANFQRSITRALAYERPTRAQRGAAMLSALGSGTYKSTGRNGARDAGVDLLYGVMGQAEARDR